MPGHGDKVWEDPRESPLIDATLKTDAFRREYVKERAPLQMTEVQQSTLFRG